MKKELVDGVYGLMKDGALKLHSDIADAELGNVEYIVVKKGFTCIKMLRQEVEELYDFDGAQEKAASFGKGWRCVSRHEWIDLYDMRFAGLDSLRLRLGMEPINGWYWTCDVDADPQYSAANAWYAHDNGLLNYYYKRYGNRVCAVSAFQL